MKAKALFSYTQNSLIISNKVILDQKNLILGQDDFLFLF